MILGVVITLLALVAILCLFATGISDASGENASRGSAFYAIFGNEAANLPTIGILVTAFVLQIVGATFALISSFAPGKLGMIGFWASAILLVAGSAIMLFAALPSYRKAVDISESAWELKLGVGFILNGVFGLLAGLLGLYAGNQVRKA